MQIKLYDLIKEFQVALVFLTRLPAMMPDTVELPLQKTVWAFPFVGLIVGFFAGLIVYFATLLGLPDFVAACLGILTAVIMTGALHEDALSDVADGFGGGWTKKDKLKIMSDSRIGAYGASALVIALATRIGALTAVISLAGHDSWLVIPALMAVGSMSRAAMAVPMAFLPSAKATGLSARAGNPPHQTAAVAIGISAIIAVICLGPIAGIATIAACAMTVGFTCLLAHQQIGGQTGDVLGTCQQVAEITSLIVLSSSLLA